MFKKVASRSLLAVIALIMALSLLGSLATQQSAAAASIPQATAAETSNAKYVFLFIGDGMGVAQRSAAELYKANLADTKTGAWQEVTLLMNSFPAQGMTTTYDAGSIITDSASAGTAIATGQKTLSGVISMDAEKKNKLETIAEVAHDKGWKVGIITSVSLDHATPAVFYAHTSSRKNMYAIAEQMVWSGFEYFAGGSLAQRKGSDGKSLDNLIFAQKAGYKVVEGDKAEFEKLTSSDGKVIAINPVVDNDAAMPYEMDRTEGEITLAEFTRKGIELLDNPTGFFMMVEGGKIDWACHANDAMASIRDTLAFDDAIAEAYKFYEEHPGETVIIVTGDHETGGMTIGFAGTQYDNFFKKLENQKVSFLGFDQKLADFKAAHQPAAKFADVLPLIEENFGLKVYSQQELADMNTLVKKGSTADATDADKAAGKEAQAKLSMALDDGEISVLETAFAESMKKPEDRSKDEAAYLLYGGYEPLTIKLTTILNNKAGIGWTSYSHTGTPVQTSAVGVGSELFNGFYDNTDIYTKMMQIAGFAK
jgi:alkaline phosphatase